MNDSAVKLLQNALGGFVLTKRRYHLLAATMKEIPGVESLAQSRGLNPARIGNDAVFQMLRDCFDMFVIDLASLREGLVERHGLLDRLRSEPSLLRRAVAAEFGPRKIVVIGDGDHDAIRAETDLWEREQIASSINDALSRLIPVEYPVTGAAVDQLIKRFRVDTDPIDKDRNHVRAHRYEHRPLDRIRYFQSLDSWEAHLKTFEEYLLDLHLVLTHNSYLPRLDFTAGSKYAARDLADMIVLGSIGNAVAEYEAVQRPAPRPVSRMRTAARQLLICCRWLQDESKVRAMSYDARRCNALDAAHERSK